MRSRVLGVNPSDGALAPELSERQLWLSLWSLVTGFFMILLDSTIVAVANPSIMRGLGLGDNYAGVVWVTSAYLLAYAVPLLVTGRLGDRFGPRRLYLAGLAIFTIASLWCGLSAVLPGGGLTMLVAARAVQGLGASLMSPQTMAIITRTFPPQRRGEAMGIWGSVAGIASLVGPILGGFLVDGLGWEWIFFVNVPVGIVGLIAAYRYVPRLPSRPMRIDGLGVALFVIGMFCLVFGLQEGEAYHWSTIVGPVTVPGVIVTGLVVLVAFVVWQAVEPGDPLLPLQLFADRNFALSNLAIVAVGFAITCVPLPLVFYLQTVHGLSPSQGALLLAPSAIVSTALARSVGRLVDRVPNPRVLSIPAVLLYAAGIAGYSVLMRSPDTAWGWFLVPAVFVGLGAAGLFGPISTTANRALPPQLAGAGSGVFNTTRQLGAVLGSASIAALMEIRISALVPGAEMSTASPTGTLPEAVRAPFSLAMSQSILLPVAVLGVALVATAFYVPHAFRRAAPSAPSAPAGGRDA